MPGLGGLAINHAFAHGRPVLCGPADGCEQDLIKTGVTGWLMKDNSDETLDLTLLTAFSHMDKWCEMGENAFRLITEKITLNRFAATLEMAAFVAAGREPALETVRDAHPIP